MRLKVKDMDISTGGIQVVLLNRNDAEKLDLHPEDRIRIKKGRKFTSAVLDIAESKKAVPKGSIGVFEEVLKKVGAKQGDIIKIDLEEKPDSVHFIKKKLFGDPLTKKEIDKIVKDIVEGNLSEIEMTYFISACFSNKMSMDETVNLTRSIVEHGDRLKLNSRVILDKHCTGGVPGNRTTMLVVPIIAAAGLTIPKTSSRSITSPSGTADTMEVLASVSIDVKHMKKIVEKVNACIVWGGALNLASADDKLIKIRHPVSLDPEGMLLASIMAKKHAVNAKKVLIDIPLGRDTKIKNKKDAMHLKREFVKLGKRLGMHVKVMLSDGTQPIGNGIGPSLEAKDVLYVLKRDQRRPLDLERKSLHMASILMSMAGIKEAKRKAKDILESGLAYKKMKEIISAQGGNPNINPDNIPLGRFKYTINAWKSGKIIDIDNRQIARIARIAGAPLDKNAGIFLYKHERQKVSIGEPIFTIYSDSKTKMKYARRVYERFGGVKIN